MILVAHSHLKLSKVAAQEYSFDDSTNKNERFVPFPKFKDLAYFDKVPFPGLLRAPC